MAKKMTTTQSLLKDLEDFDKSPESRGYDLRLDLADIILRHLDHNGWTQKKLAEAAGMKPPLLTRVIHGASNCTLDTAGRILFALGIQGKLIEADAVNSPGTTRAKSVAISGSKIPNPAKIARDSSKAARATAR